MSTLAKGNAMSEVYESIELDVRGIRAQVSFLLDRIIPIPDPDTHATALILDDVEDLLSTLIDGLAHAATL